MSEFKNDVFHIGPIRPPSEATSLLLQVTAGCTWNKCKFCQLYRNSKFKAYTVESIKADIDVMVDYRDMILKHQRPSGSFNREAAQRDLEKLSPEAQNCYYMIYNWLACGGQNVFLQDGNTLALTPGKLTEVLLYLRSKFPRIKRITSYGRAETLSKVTTEQYAQLKAAGLDRIHSGFETGSDEVLKLINKGVTAEQQITAGKNIKAGGIELSVYFMPGVGGKDLSEENALGTAKVVKEIDPDFVRIRTAVVKKDTELWADYEKGSYRLCSENDKVREIRTLIENCKDCNGILASDHIINLLQNVAGRLKQDNAAMLGSIDEYLSLPELEQRCYQLARRSGLVSEPTDMARLPGAQKSQIDQACSGMEDDGKWNLKMNEIMMNYI